MRLSSLLTLICLLDFTRAIALPAFAHNENIPDDGFLGVLFKPEERLPNIIQNQVPQASLPAGRTAHLLLYTIDALWRMKIDQKPITITDRLVGMRANFASHQQPDAVVNALTMGWAMITLLETLLWDHEQDTDQWNVGLCIFTPGSGGLSYGSVRLTQAIHAVGSSNDKRITNGTIALLDKRQGDLSTSIAASDYQNMAELDIVYQVSYRYQRVLLVSMVDLAFRALANNAWQTRPRTQVQALQQFGNQIIIGPNQYGDFMNIAIARTSVNLHGEQIGVTWALVGQAIISLLADPVVENNEYGFSATIRVRRPNNPELSDVFLQIVIAKTRHEATVDSAVNATSSADLIAVTNATN